MESKDKTGLSEPAGLTVAVLSGKGGTGKTLISVNLAAAAESAVYVDCDVEEPNGDLFFRPEGVYEETVAVAVPVVEETLCTGCRACVDFCRFNALAFVRGKPLVFPAVCHACGGCALVCPSGAIREAEKPVGLLRRGRSQTVETFSGELNPGEPSGVPLIRRLMRLSGEEAYALRIVDCPPGSACAVMESIKDADYCLLVAEPTIYGRQNLALVHALAALLKKPFGVILNKCTEGGNPSEEYCREYALPVVGRLDFDAALYRLASGGGLAARESDEYRERFVRMLGGILEEARHAAADRSER